MGHPIKRDHARFKKIVKGKLRQNLRKFISQGQMPTPKSDGRVKIPMPTLDTPRFKFGSKDQGGTGQGQGQPGDPVDGEEGEEEGAGEAGENEGGKEREVDMTIEELASILAEELALPNIEPKGKKSVTSSADRYKSIGLVGPNSLRHFKRSYRQALRRQITTGSYDEKNPVIVPVRGDFRYRVAKSIQKEEHAAVVIYIMDVSGSMGDEQKEIVRTESFWINLWLKHQYKDIDIRYIIHDATAKEVDEETFFSTRESGGTLISSAYKLCRDIIKADYDPNEWNIYPFQFSDGDNWSNDDTRECLQILEQDIIPASNMFCYGQVDSRYGSGQFYNDLNARYGKEHEKMILSRIPSKEAIMDSIKEFLSKGK